MSIIAKLIARNVKPSFTHDCDRCVFLGSLDGCDLYYCPGDRSLSYRHGNAGPAYGAISLEIARQFKGDGSPYSLAFALLARGAKTPNAYATPDGRFTPRKRAGETCGGCEDCDGEDVCDAERVALQRAEARIAIDDYSCAIG